MEYLLYVINHYYYFVYNNRNYHNISLRIQRTGSAFDNLIRINLNEICKEHSTFNYICMIITLSASDTMNIWT